jgi:hypothetical protein
VILKCIKIIFVFSGWKEGRKGGKKRGREGRREGKKEDLIESKNMK